MAATGWDEEWPPSERVGEPVGIAYRVYESIP